MTTPPAFSLRTSGDLLADRRFAYADAARDDNDPCAAADLYAQVLELVPDWPPAHLELGKALAALGDHAGARAAFRNALRLDPADRLGAGLELAALSGEAPGPDAMSDAFVTALFDAYAPRFDTHLAQGLKYRAPQLIRAAIERAAAQHSRPLRFKNGLDLGCGTGLMAREIPGWCAGINGVDLSGEMLELARISGHYSRLKCMGILPFLDVEPAESSDLVLAADVFCYVPDLASIFAATRRVMMQAGLFAFSVQTHPGDGVIIGGDQRVHHAPDWIRKHAIANGFEIAFEQTASSRIDRGVDVPGAVFVLTPV